MKPSSHQPDDKRVQQSLERRIAHTSSSLETRFAALKNRLSAESRNPVPAPFIPRWKAWIPALTAAAAVLILSFSLWQIQDRGPGAPATAYEDDFPFLQIDDLDDLDKALDPALVLLDAEILETLIAMPYENDF